MIEVTANKTKGFIGAKIVNGAKNSSLVLIILYKILGFQNYKLFPIHFRLCKLYLPQLDPPEHLNRTLQIKLNR